MVHVARYISIWCICSPWVNDFVVFLFIRMSLQNMDKHLDILKICCRLCGKKLVKGARKTKVQLFYLTRVTPSVKTTVIIRGPV